MSSRDRRPVKPEETGSKVRKSKYSPAGPSHGSGAEGTKCTFVSESCETGTKLEEPKIATSSPHEGADLSDLPITLINAVPKVSIVGGDNIKIRKLSDQIVLTTAGDTQLCDMIIQNVKNLIKVTNGSDSMKFLKLKKYLRTFRRKWKAHHWGQRFPAELMLCGKYEGEITIFVIRRHATEKVQVLQSRDDNRLS